MVEDGRCDSLASGPFPTTVREVAFPTKGLDFIMMSVDSGLRFYKDLGVPKLGGAALYYRTGPPSTGGEFQRGSYTYIYISQRLL